MLRIVEKNIILIASLIASIILYGKNFFSVDTQVVIFLVALILTELGSYVENRKTRLGILGLFTVLCLIQWQFIFFIPVAVFFIVEESFNYGYLIFNAIQLSIISVVFCHREPLFFMPKNFKNITKNS